MKEFNNKAGQGEAVAFDHADLGELLTSLGWRAEHDPLWERLEAAHEQIGALIQPAGIHVSALREIAGSHIAESAPEEYLMQIAARALNAAPSSHNRKE